MELLVSGNKFDDYTIESVLSNSYNYRTVYRVIRENDQPGVLIVYDMDAYKGTFYTLFGMWLPSEFYFAYCVQKKVGPEVYDVGENHQYGNFAWMCQEFVFGLSLGAFLSVGRDSSYDEYKDLAVKMCMSMVRFSKLLPECAHYNLTPENFIITVNEEGVKTPVLIGFLHVASDSTNAFRHPENSYGLIYKAPEMMAGTYTLSSDVFAMAVILCEMFMGDNPWHAKWSRQQSYTNSKRVLANIRRQKPQVSGVPKEVEQVILHALLPKSKRYADITQFATVLRDAMGDFEQQRDDEVHRIPITLDDFHEEPDANSPEEESTESPLEEMGRPRAHAKMEKKKGDGFAAVAGMEQLKSDLTQNFINVLRYSDMAKTYGIQPPNGMLLYGPPGCGKSYLASRLAEEVGINASFVRPSDLGSTYIHGSQSMIADLFKKAEKNAPTILVFDEIDALVPSRAFMGESVSLSGEVNEFLTQLESCSQRGIFVVGTTNRIEQIDPAVLRTGRIEEVVYVPLPDRDNRMALLKMELKGKPCKRDIDYDRLADLTERFTMSDVSYAVKKACRKAFDRAVTQGMGLHSRIDMELLEKAITETMPSVDLKAEKGFEQQRKEYEGRKRVKSAESHTIGFRTSH